MARPKRVYDPAVLFVHLEREEHEALRLHAERRHTSISDIVRDLVAQELTRAATARAERSTES
jgi:hypothetical protein